MSQDLLAIYLTDHFAGAVAGSQRMQRLADAERSAPDGAVLATIAREIEEDRRTLQAILEAAHVKPRWHKNAVAWLVVHGETTKTEVMVRPSGPTHWLGRSMATIGAAGEALTNARDQLTLAEGRYAHGLGSAVELGDAQVAYTTAEAQVVQARFGLASARAQLIAALGER